METETIPTGIYRHSNGNLFFVEGTGSLFDPMEADKLAVFLRKLVNDGRRCCVIKENFDKEEGFRLVQALPIEKMRMLLPGARVAFSEKGLEHQVVRIFEDRSVIFVQLLDKVFATRLSYFLKKAFLLETF